MEIIDYSMILFKVRTEKDMKGKINLKQVKSLKEEDQNIYWHLGIIDYL